LGKGDSRCRSAGLTSLGGLPAGTKNLCGQEGTTSTGVESAATEVMRRCSSRCVLKKIVTEANAHSVTRTLARHHVLPARPELGIYGEIYIEKCQIVEHSDETNADDSQQCRHDEGTPGGRTARPRDEIPVVSRHAVRAMND